MTTNATQNPFSEQVIDAVRNHMNLDHTDDSLLIVRSLGKTPDATAAEVSGLDGAKLEFAATVGDRQTTVTVPWSAPITERPQIRAEIEQMYQDACSALGITPRAAEEH
jgi:hypothetical protein